jgi:SAM-dependent methyltransferase
LVTPGWALDLGCGSGVSSRYLAHRGFRVVGVDLASTALARAQLLAAAEDAAVLFCAGDVTDLAFLAIQATLAIDVGCFHSVPAERRRSYVASLAARLLSGAHYLLYAFEPFQSEQGRSSGIGPREIGEFAPHFALCWSQHGWDRERPSAWYLFRRKPISPRAVGC